MRRRVVWTKRAKVSVVDFDGLFYHFPPKHPMFFFPPGSASYREPPKPSQHKNLYISFCLENASQDFVDSLRDFKIKLNEKLKPTGQLILEEPLHGVSDMLLFGRGKAIFLIPQQTAFAFCEFCESSYRDFFHEGALATMKEKVQTLLSSEARSRKTLPAL